MAQKEYAGKMIDLDDNGYFVNSDQWSREVATAIAAEDGDELTDKHFEVLEFIRDKVTKGESLTIRSIGKSGITDIKSFYKLFPGAPLKKATKYAGVSKPSSCV
ncbi:MAG: TusE/DsrC/DsvC family sulfur relay protein [Bacteroidales bacterium]|nr:TusE/DsrC/DsvC family sulfur relay protein [Bacteroidales bacterium]